jgi:hypothetical protein
VRYRFGPLERRGLVAGWRGGQIATIGSGLVIAVLVLRADSSLTGALVVLVPVGVTVAAATWPIGGRTAEEWAPDAVRYTIGPGRRRRSRANPFATLRLVSVDLVSLEKAGSRRVASSRARIIGASGSAGLRSATSRLWSESVPREAGVVVDTAAGTYTAVLVASGVGFVLLGDEDKVHRVGTWSGVLASLAREGSAVHRVQWVQRNVPDGTTEPLDQTGTDGAVMEGRAVDGKAAAYRSYASLVRDQAAVSQRHEVLLAVSVHEGRAARQVKTEGGGLAGACSLVLREAAGLRRRLAEAGIDAGNVLGPDALSRTFRRAFEISRETRGPTGRRSWPWPMGMHSEWARLLTDGTWHATYWISEWPRTDVGPDFLGPLLLLPEVRRAVSLVMEPLGPAQAARKIEQARTADIADSELRRRGGFLATARRRREQEVLVEREIELADGHAPFRFSGYVTVSAAGLEELEDACARTEQSAARCGLELRLCYGDQARAFLATLPLCRGLA